jgi:type IV secretion system protein VirB11
MMTLTKTVHTSRDMGVRAQGGDGDDDPTYKTALAGGDELTGVEEGGGEQEVGYAAEEREHTEHLDRLVRLSIPGALLALLEDDDITEVSANPDGSVWIDTHSRGAGLDTGIRLPRSVRRAIVEKVASANDSSVSAHAPSISATLPGFGARFEGLVRPAVSAAAFSIRLPSARIVPFKDYVESGSLTRTQAHRIYTLINDRKNVVVAGSTGSGKTTLANTLLYWIGESNDRVITIEDIQELRSKSKNCVQLYVEREGAFGYREAVIASLRLRPDRIIVGELRDGRAALELLKAWNTGHGGGLSTIHSNSASATLPRLESLLGEVVKTPPRELIAQAIDAVVYMEKYESQDGTTRRRVRDVALVSDELDSYGRYALDHDYHPSVNP